MRANLHGREGRAGSSASWQHPGSRTIAPLKSCVARSRPAGQKSIVNRAEAFAARFAAVKPRAYGQGTSYDAGSYQSAGPPSQYAGSNMMGRQNSTASLASVDSGNAALKTKDQPKTTQVRFWLKFHVEYGQTIRIIGGTDSMGAWNMSKAPFLKWSDGDLWNVTLELAAGGVYEYKYVVVEGDGTTAASWQRGGNNVLALQMNDEEVEVYDNWKNAPGAIVLVNGNETTRERKLLAWAGDMTVQRAELRRTRMELAQAREEIRVLRAELSVLRMEVSEANIARAAAEARQLELERQNSALKLEVASSQASAKSTMEEAVRLLTSMDDDSGNPSSSHTSASFQPVTASTGGGDGAMDHSRVVSSSSSANGAAGGGGNGVFGSLFGFQAPNGNGRVTNRMDSEAGLGPSSNAASAVVAAAAAMAAAAGHDSSSSNSGYSPYRGNGSPMNYSSSGGNGSAAAGGGSAEVVSANSTKS